MKLRNSIFLALALCLLLGAVFFPAGLLEERKADHLEHLEQEKVRLENLLQPEDDFRVDPVTRPWNGVSGSAIFRGFLVADAFLFAVLAWWARGKRFPDLVESRHSRRDLAIVSLLALLALLVRLPYLAGDLWIDEITTLMRHASGPLIDIFLQATSSNNHLLNSVLGHISIATFGISTWSLRLPALIFGCLTVPVCFLIGRTGGRSLEGYMAALLVAFSYHHIFFSTNARGYCGYMFGALASAYFLDQLLRGRKVLLPYVIALLVSALSLLLGLMVLVSHLLVIGLTMWRKRSEHAPDALRASLLSGYLVAHAYAFMVPDVLGFIFDDYQRGSVGWGFSVSFLREIHRGLLPFLPFPVVVVALLIGAGILVFGFVSYCKNNFPLGLSLTLPVLILAGLTLILGLKVYPRFFVLVLPVSCLLLSRFVYAGLDATGLSKKQRLAAGRLLLACSVGASLFILWSFGIKPKQDYTGARAFVEAAKASNAPVVAVGVAGESYRYYWPEIEVTNRVSRVRELLANSEEVWLLWTLPRDMQSRRPKLFQFVQEVGERKAEFPSAIPGGSVVVFRLRLPGQVTD